MTAEEKTALAGFLDLAGDYLKDGHARNREPYSFENDDAPAAEPGGGDFSSLPLAFRVDEDEEETGWGSLEDISAEIAVCASCGLAAERTLAVPGEGVSRPLVMVIGEGPGADEDKAGRPFVGKAGQLLDKMLASIGLYRDKNCFIANMVKCRPPGNRDPGPDEIAACLPFLERQIELLHPCLILCAGRVAAQNLLRTSQGIGALRGQFINYHLAEEIKTGQEPVPALCTFHPSAILRDEALKRPAWEDLKLLKSKLISIVGEYAALPGEG